MEAQGKKNKLYKNDVLEFDNAEKLNEYIEENSIQVLSGKDFKSGNKENCIALIKAFRQVK
jgi:hypothetical protein